MKTAVMVFDVNNGTLAVYDSIRGTDRGDLFWRPVGGGSEVQLQMP